MNPQPTGRTPTAPPLPWVTLDPASAPTLSGARLQLHHAAQLATAFGISFAPARADDGHTNLEWLAESGVLASNARDGARVALRVADLTLLVDERRSPSAARPWTLPPPGSVSA